MIKKKNFFEEYVAPNADFLREYARLVELKGDNERIVLTEALSRYVGERCLYDASKSGDFELRQDECWLVHQPVDARYDIDYIYDGDIPFPVEVKCRACKSTDYPTTDLSASKGDFISGRTGLVLIAFLEDSKYFIFNLQEYTPPKNKWFKPVTTACDNGDRIEEERYQFDLSRAVHSGRFKWGKIGRR